MRNRWDLFDDEFYDMERMAREAVDRSCGQLVEFSMEHFGTDELLEYIADEYLNMTINELAGLAFILCYSISCSSQVLGDCDINGMSMWLDLDEVPSGAQLIRLGVSNRRFKWIQLYPVVGRAF
ncbi:hypothetical protein C5167_010549 [Papaver somniferum]|uniref:Uncharacterized protein n=1 Tax=Papaver somniferum TaxID=3469 RepID=A0A4Y7K3C1_PAPSO|nr:hypothetical protein C5167_010549 [Papaver somniferum]